MLDKSSRLSMTSFSFNSAVRSDFRRPPFFHEGEFFSSLLNISYYKLLKTGSLDNAIQDFLLAYLL